MGVGGDCAGSKRAGVESTLRLHPRDTLTTRGMTMQSNAVLPSGGTISLSLSLPRARSLSRCLVRAHTFTRSIYTCKMLT